MTANCKQWPRCACILRGKQTDCPTSLAALPPLTAQERRTMETLKRKWATRRASVAEIERCRSLENRAASGVK